MRVLFVFVLLSTLTFAQPEDVPAPSLLNRNSISFDAGWALLAYGIGLKYERLSPSKKHNMYTAFSIGANYHEVNFFSIDRHFMPSVRLGLITGKKIKHHFEVMGGGGLLYTRPIGKSAGMIWPAFNLGYRYQVPEQGFVFRTGVGFPEFLYVGFGISF